MFEQPMIKAKRVNSKG